VMTKNLQRHAELFSSGIQVFVNFVVCVRTILMYLPRRTSKLVDSNELHGVLDDHMKHDKLNYQVVFGCSTFTIEVSFSSIHIYSVVVPCFLFVNLVAIRKMRNCCLADVELDGTHFLCS
jgi:hypothetical protein